MITNNVNTKEIVDFVLKNFPSNIQLDILQEECAELIQALSKYKRVDYTNFTTMDERLDNVIEEMAHVLISIDVVTSLLNIDVPEIQNEINKKCKKYIPHTIRR